MIHRVSFNCFVVS